MTGSSHDVDHVIAEWQRRLHLIDDNLLVLEQDSTMVFLQHMTSRGQGLAGVTRTRVSRAMAAYDEIRSERMLLDETIEKAIKLRGRVRFLMGESSLGEIEALFSGESIILPTDGVPLGQRSLLTGAQTISPDALLRRMIQAYEEMRDLVALIGEAWDRQKRDLDQARASLAGLRSEVSDQAPQLIAEVDAIAALVSELSARLLSDPLAAAEDWRQSVQPRVATVRALVEQRREQRAKTAARLKAARLLVDELRDCQAACERFFKQLPTVIDGIDPAPVPISADQVDGLRSWLDTLRTMDGGVHQEAMAVGLARWTSTAESYRELLVANAHVNGQPIADRDDLLGLLSARRAQAAALLIRGILLPPDMAEIVGRADEILRSIPARLEEARPLVERYDHAVQSAADRHSGPDSTRRLI